MRIGTWNLENLFRPGPGDGPEKHSDYETKLDGLAEVITGLAPELLALQEIGDPRALADLIGRLDGRWWTALADPDGRGIRVGIISTRDLTMVEEITDFPDRLGGVQIDDAGRRLEAMGRPALRARVVVEGRAIDLVSAHLKSKLLSYPDGRFSPNDEGERARYAVYALHRRAAEAAAVRAGLDRLIGGDGSNRSVVLAGDLNDEPDSATTQILLGPGGSEIGTSGYDRPDRGDADRLWNLAPLIPEPDRYSRIYRGRGELIDHILVSHALVGSVIGVTTGALATPSVTDDPDERDHAAVSDHRPIVATLRL